MAILIDPPAWPAHGRRWSHLVSDDSVGELHAFAERIGIPRRAFEGDHYDVPEERYAAVLAAGAVPTPPRELLEALRRSGLRMPKRRGDRGVEIVRGVCFPDGTRADVDLIASPRPAPERRVFAAMALVRDAAGALAVVYSVARAEWGAPGGWREPGESVTQNAVREVHEETGLCLDPEALEPIGYERFRPHAPGRLWRPGRDLLQGFRAEVPGVRPRLGTAHDDTSDRRWVSPAEFEAMCAHLFWWPLAEHVLSRRGD